VLFILWVTSFVPTYFSKLIYASLISWMQSFWYVFLLQNKASLSLSWADHKFSFFFILESFLAQFFLFIFLCDFFLLFIVCMIFTGLLQRLFFIFLMSRQALFFLWLFVLLLVLHSEISSFVFIKHSDHVFSLEWPMIHLWFPFFFILVFLGRFFFSFSFVTFFLLFMVCLIFTGLLQRLFFLFLMSRQALFFLWLFIWLSFCFIHENFFLLVFLKHSRSCLLSQIVCDLSFFLFSSLIFFCFKFLCEYFLFEVP